MTDAAWTAIAALGAAALTGLTSLGVVAFQESRRSQAASQIAYESAISVLLARSIDLARRARSAGDMMKIRSGLAEGLDVTTRLRKPLDPMEYHDWFAQDWRPLMDAWTAVWAVADQQTVSLANELIERCADLLEVSTAAQPASTTVERARRFFRGQRWTYDMLAAYAAALQSLAEARINLTTHARERLGRDPVVIRQESAP